MQFLADVVGNDEELFNPIFIVGCLGPGTSVLARVIARASSVCYLEKQGLIASFHLRDVPLCPGCAYVWGGESIIRILKAKIKETRDRFKGNDKLRDLVIQAKS